MPRSAGQQPVAAEMERRAIVSTGRAPCQGRGRSAGPRPVSWAHRCSSSPSHVVFPVWSVPRPPLLRRTPALPLAQIRLRAEALGVQISTQKWGETQFSPRQQASVDPRGLLHQGRPGRGQQEKLEAFAHPHRLQATRAVGGLLPAATREAARGKGARPGASQSSSNPVANHQTLHCLLWALK